MTHTRKTFSLLLLMFDAWCRGPPESTPPPSQPSWAFSVQLDLSLPPVLPQTPALHLPGRLCRFLGFPSQQVAMATAKVGAPMASPVPSSYAKEMQRGRGSAILMKKPPEGPPVPMLAPTTPCYGCVNVVVTKRVIL